MKLKGYLTNYNAYDIFSATDIKIKAFLYDDETSTSYIDSPKIKFQSDNVIFENGRNSISIHNMEYFIDIMFQKECVILRGNDLKMMCIYTDDVDVIKNKLTEY